jgi:hypothetical protein
VRQTDGLKTTTTLGTVNRHGPDLAVELALQITFPLPDQDRELTAPDREIGVAQHHPPPAPLQIVLGEVPQLDEGGGHGPGMV